MAVFQPGLTARGISLRGAQGQVVLTNTEAAIVTLVRQFVAQYPGFCPLQDEPFVSDDAQQRFMTVAARGHEVRVLTYDCSPGSRINAVIGSGVATQSLAVRRCAGS